MIDYVRMVSDDIDKDSFCTLIFKIKDGKVVRFEKTHSVNLDELKAKATE